MMIFKGSSELFSVIKYFTGQRYISALYITGERAQKNFAVLTPVIDFDKQLENKTDLKQNVEKRGLKIDVEQLEKRWNFFKNIKERKTLLEQTRLEIGQSIASLLKNPDLHKQDIEKLKIHARIIKDDLKHLKEFYYEVEEDTMVKILDMPNNLHNNTPDTPTPIHIFLENREAKSDSHMNIAKRLGYVKYLDSFTCFLKSDAAAFELGIQNFFRNSLLVAGYTQFSNSNFSRSVVIEGCGKSYIENPDVITLQELDAKENENNRLHLCGSASLYPFMAYFTRHSVNETNLPMKFFSLGKIYHPVDRESPKNLFNLGQEAGLNVFVATLDDQDIFETITKQVSEFYESLGYHFRLVLLPANQLDKSESLKVSIQMFSNFESSYVEVGNISLHENFISKRLLFTYNSKKIRKYPKVVSGTLINVPKLLGCVLENNSLNNSPLLSDLLKNHLF